MCTADIVINYSKFMIMFLEILQKRNGRNDFHSVNNNGKVFFLSRIIRAACTVILWGAYAYNIPLVGKRQSTCHIPQEYSPEVEMFAAGRQYIA